MKVKIVSIITSICILTTPLSAFASNLQLSLYKKDMNHDDIKFIQKALKKDGVYNHNEFTSYFGTITEKAVIDFQRKYGLTPDGVIGSTTIDKMESLGLFTYGVLTQSIYEKGMDHPEVKILQQALKSLGLYNYGEFTTYYGDITETAVIDFQRKYDLLADGVVGGTTINKMKELGLVSFSPNGQNKVLGTLTLPVYEKGLNDAEVKLLQRALNAVGVYNYGEYTTYFGPVTEEAVKAFQKKYGLTVDGVAGSSTIEKLKSLGLIAHNVSRGSTQMRKFGEYLDWNQVKKMLARNKTILTVQDFATGLQFKVKYTAGSNHADVEALTIKDTNIIKKIWGGFSWVRRPVLVYLNGRTIAASMTAMPHAGVEGKAAGKYVSGRSGGYGYGYNYDFVKGNGMSGHVDIHFKNSRRHKDNRQDSQHQSAIKKSAGLR